MICSKNKQTKTNKAMVNSHPPLPPNHNKFNSLNRSMILKISLKVKSFYSDIITQKIIVCNRREKAFVNKHKGMFLV